MRWCQITISLHRVLALLGIAVASLPMSSTVAWLLLGSPTLTDGWLAFVLTGLMLWAFAFLRGFIEYAFSGYPNPSITIGKPRVLPRAKAREL